MLHPSRRFAPCLPVILYHGSQAERAALRSSHLNESTAVEGIEKSIRNVFVTSFEIAMNDRAHFKRVLWRYIVVDEGHRLKNMNCRLIRELKQYESVNRLLLTGILQDPVRQLGDLSLICELFKARRCRTTSPSCGPSSTFSWPRSSTTSASSSPGSTPSK